nr:reverse transcriptase domain-containing protein [Tanacetum cinerariifolium]
MDVRRQVPPARKCTYQDFMKCKPLYFKGTEGVVELTQWFKRMEIVFRISNCTVENQIKFATCTLLESALTWWNSQVTTVGPDVSYAMNWTNIKKKITDKYCSRGEIKKLKCELWNLRVKSNDVGHFKRECLKLKNNNRVKQARNGNALVKVYAVGHAGTNPDSNIVTELGGFDVIIGMDWLTKYQAVIVCAEKIIHIPWGSETLIVRGDGSDRGNETHLNIISCTKTQKYMLKGCHVYLAHVTTKETEDKLKKQRLKDVPIVRD